MKHRVRTGLLLAGVMGLFLALPGVGFGQMNGHNLRGDYGLMSGTQLPPGYYGGMMYVEYGVDAVLDRNGDKLGRAGSEITLEGVAPFFMLITEKQLLGANYAFLIAPSWLNNRLDSPLLEADLEVDTGFSDLYAQPVHLGWHKEQVDYVAGLGLFMPTGRYEDGADDNTGLGMWSFEVFGGVTYFFDKEKSWHASMLATYETHTEKEDSDAKVGDLLTLEGGVGKSYMDGAISLGCAYAAQWKVTDDDFGGSPLDRIAEKHQIYSIGPDIVLPVFGNEKAFGLLNVRYLLDFDVESNTEGETLLVTFVVGSM